MAVAGKCSICRKKVPARSMRTHVLDHYKGKAGKGALLVRITNPGTVYYWLYARVNKKASLADLDGLIRETWVECCGHLSSFKSQSTLYNSMGEDDMYGGDQDTKGMDVNAVKVLSTEGALDYEYDFGTTTELVVKAAGECPGAGMKGTVEVVARNEDIPHDCGSCGAKGAATEICSSCIWADKNPLLCAKCVKKHEHDEDQDPVDEASFLPVVNSPRMGMCGYTGED